MPSPIRTGIFAKTFPGSDPLTVLQAARAAGYASVQYNMACSGLPPMPDAIAPDMARAVAEAARETGLTIAALSGTWNMIHPDPAIRAEGQRRLAVLAEAAPLIGTTLITLCTGTRDADDQWRAHPDNDGAQAWADLLTEMETGRDAGRGPRPPPRDRARAGQCRQQRRKGPPAARHAAIRRALHRPRPRQPVRDRTRPFPVHRPAPSTLLAGRIAMAHAKDRAPDGSFTAAGTGVVDFPAFLDRLRDTGFTGDLITHGLSADEAPEVARFLKTLTA
jgi:sugar phosphate isomerase/epimerase